MSWLRWPRCWSGRRGCERPAGHGPDRDAGLRVHHAQMEPGRGRDRLPDRARAGGRERRAVGTSTIVGLWQPQRTVTPNAAGVRGVRLPARRPLPVARARAARHRQPAAVLGARGGHDAGPLGPGRAAGRRRRSADRRRPAPRTRTRPRPRRPTSRPRWTPRATACGSSSSARTLQNRPMNMFIIGYPKPPDTAAAISDDADGTRSTATCTATRPPAASRASRWRASSRSRTDPAIIGHADQDDGADRAVDQRRRPRRQPARQLARARTSTATTR